MVRGKQGEGGARIEERMRKREDLATPMSRKIVGRHRSLVGTLLLFALVGQAHAFSAPGLCGKFTLRPCVARKGVPRSSTKLSHPSKPKTYRLRRSEMLRMGPVEQVDAGRLEEQLKAHTGLMVVDFFTPDCAPCKLIAPQLDKVAAEYGSKITFLKIDAEQSSENQALTTKLQAFALPTLFFIRDGKIVERAEGAMLAPKIKSLCEHIFFDGPIPQGWKPPNVEIRQIVG